MAARWLSLTVASWSALLAVFSVGSVANRAAGDSEVALVLNVVLLALSLLGWADVVWHDIRGRLIMPSLPMHKRHKICVATYATMAGIFGIRAFAVAELPVTDRVLITGYYLATAVGIALVAVALAFEDREPQRET